MQRGRRRRGKSGGPPRPLEQIRLPQGPVSARKLPRQIRLGPVEPFSFRPDKTLPGTLHHSGIRPAPPSDHTPLARRSAFCAHGTGAWNSKARAGLKRLQRGFSPCRGAASYLSAHEPWNFAIPLPLCRGTGDFHESQRRRICAHEIGDPGLLEVAISDRRLGQVGKDRSKACPVGHAPCPVKDRSRVEARSALTDVLIGVRTGYSRPLSAPFAGVQPAHKSHMTT